METKVTPCFIVIVLHVCFVSYVVSCVVYSMFMHCLYEFVLCCDCVLWNILCRLVCFVLYELCVSCELWVLGLA